MDWKNWKGWPHVTIAGYNCCPRRLNNLELIYDFLRLLPGVIGMRAIGAPVVYRVTKDQHPDIGVTGFQIIATSHISIHTFAKGQKDGKRKPRGIEKKIFKPFFTLDVFSCSEFDPDIVLKEVKRMFKPKFVETALIYRLREDEGMIEVEDNY